MDTEGDMLRIALRRCEALVFFEWIASLDVNDGLQLDAAVQRILWRVEGQLEKDLTEILAADYKDRVASARKEVLD